MFGLKTALEEGARTVVSLVEVHCIGGTNAGHEIGYVIFACLAQQKMELCGKKRVGEQIDTAFEHASVLESSSGEDATFGFLFEGSEVVGENSLKTLIIEIILEDEAIVDAFVVDVVIRLWVKVGFSDWHITPKLVNSAKLLSEYNQHSMDGGEEQGRVIFSLKSDGTVVVVDLFDLIEARGVVVNLNVIKLAVEVAKAGRVSTNIESGRRVAGNVIGF